MHSSPREEYVPLTRWQYFTKNLYTNPAKERVFVYNKVVYEKSQELQDIEQRSSRVNYGLVLLLILMFILTSQFQQVYLVVAYLLLVIAGQAFRFLMLPKDISAHLTDTHRRER